MGRISPTPLNREIQDFQDGCSSILHKKGKTICGIDELKWS